MKLAMRVVVAISSLAVPIVLAAYHAAARGDYEFGTRFHTVWLLAYGVLFMLAAFVVGVPSLVRRFRQAILGAALATAVPLGIASIFFVIYDPRIPRFIVVATPLCLFVIYFACSVGNVLSTNRSESTDLVIVVLDGDERVGFERSVRGSREKQFTLVEMLNTSSFTTIDEGVLFERITKGQANLIVLSEGSQLNPLVVEHAAHFHERGVRVRSLAAFYDEWLGKLPISELRRTGMWFDIKDLHEQFYPRLKRLMDVVIALAVTPILLLVVPVVAVANLFGNRGSLFFSQERVGHRGNNFHIHKFRTMVPNAVASGEGTWTVEDDPRITKFGKFLRRSHLDELPQILNVLRGDLSVVGPRPEQSHYVRTLTEEIPFYGLRHAVRPGMTGWAQVKYPYGSTVEDSIQKLQYDLYYLQHQSLSLDMRVCVRTFASILFGQGR